MYDALNRLRRWRKALKAALDENLPPALADALCALAGAHFEDEIFHVCRLVPRGTPDVDVFQALRESGISIHITQDHHNRRQIESKAIASCGLIVFALAKAWASQPFWIKSMQLIRWWPAIREHAARMTPPAVFEVPWRLSGRGRFRQLPI